MLQTFDLVQLLKLFYSFSYLTEDYCYLSCSSTRYSSTTTRHSYWSSACITGDCTLVSPCSIPHYNLTSLTTLKQGNIVTAINVNTTTLQQQNFRFGCMTIRLVIISIRTESNITEALSPVGFFLIGAERHTKSHWMGGVYTVGRYMPRYTVSEGITLVFILLSLFLFLHAILICWCCSKYLNLTTLSSCCDFVLH